MAAQSHDVEGPPGMDLRNQLDIFDHDPARLAKANRVAAENALTDPFFSQRVRQDRHDYYIAEAERLERLAAMAEKPATTAA
ncbi:hypothetical protein I5V39_09850 [Stenotrophomonas maltophilia]|nr:hypothetical protein [Stenotrophomonas maltophilia]MBH1723665.1 hypothetical protein [Stenotrophomonas maltophilia]MBH1800794.1 hypothetical protein [Stenotrophomonas maltophilia]MBH1807186.1 hypothetical protein [Stenotrophomonas maltophilia]